MAKTEIPEWVPLFPLPTVVLFPKTYLPLHIFEPRYREMVEDALQGDRMIGMVLLKEGWEADYDGRPPIYETGSIGKIVRSQRLDDGRFNIILYGLEKCLVRTEKQDRSYRQGQIDILREPAVEALYAPLKERLVELTLEYRQKMPEGESLQSVLETGLEDDVLVATLSAGLPLTVVEKQFLLEAETLPLRARRLAALMEMGLQRTDTMENADDETA
ncbi:MAG: LON peptidase substrate-binding domain-containing protein [Nitrospirae bacterium]|nr:LON peptidase substrate-binding domain-containing protein [Candidatus Manganitrophaceae bacterium]